MTIETDNDLVFDGSDARCFYEIAQLTGDNIDGNEITYGTYIAFVQCYDKSTGYVRQLVGLYDQDNVRESIKNIMLSGAGFERVLRAFNQTA